MSYSSTVLALSPLAFWKFDEASGTNLLDASGNSQTGTYNASGVTLGVPGIINDGSGATAAQFDGSSGSASVPNSAQIAKTSFTLVFWMRYTGTVGGGVNYQVPAGMDDGSHGFAIQRLVHNDTFFLRVDDTAATNQSGGVVIGSPFDGKIHMLAVGVTGSTAFLSDNAGTYSTWTITGTYAAPTAALSFALNIVGGGFYQGILQGAAMFSGQLSQANLSALYAAGLAGAGSVYTNAPYPVQQRWDATKVYAQAGRSQFDSSPLVDVPGDHGKPAVPPIQRQDWNALKVYAQAGRAGYETAPIITHVGQNSVQGYQTQQQWNALQAYAAAGRSQFDSSPLVDVPGHHGAPVIPPVQRIDWNALKLYAQAGRSAYNSSPYVPLLGLLRPPSIQTVTYWRALSIYAQAGRSQHSSSPFIDIPAQHSVQPYPMQQRWDALRGYAQAGRAAYDSSPFISSVIPSVSPTQPVQQVIWNAVAVYAEAGMSGWQSSTIVPPVQVLRRLRFSRFEAVQSLTIQVLQVSSATSRL